MILLLVMVTVIALIFYRGVKDLLGWICRERPTGDGIMQIASVIDQEEAEEATQSSALKVEIKDSIIDTSRIKEYNGEEVKSFSWFPENFAQFIGQADAKEQAKTIIKKANRGIRCHTILSAIPGHGKSTFIRLLAKELNARLIEKVGKEIDENTLVDVVNEINTCPEKQVVFFLDEIDTTEWKVLKLLNPILQDFKISGKKIKPFCFCSATINKDSLIKSVPDLLDRIPHAIQFTRYSARELMTILRQYKDHLYPNEKVTEEILNIISINSKYNPRLGIGILEDFIVTQDIKKTLKNRKIVKEGLNELDVRVLRVLSQAKRPMGANSLSQRVGLNQKQYTQEFEPFLCEFEYINRMPSRVITSKGKKLLKEINA